MLPPAVQARCQELLGEPILKVTSLGGGDIHQARLLQTRSRPFFLKMNTQPESWNMFATEAQGLSLISSTQTIRCPKVIAFDQVNSYAFLLLEFIENGSPSERFWKNFGVALASLHKIPQSSFGLPFNNYIGSLHQPNPIMESWPLFYQEARLAPQLKMAVDTGKLYHADSILLEKLFRILPDTLPDEPPSLIHGDLWSGNFLTSIHEEGILIDPAVCFAHREMDIAMSKLFGGFSPIFYAAYQDTFALIKGWEERIPLYQLYYLLVHVNLFGGGYIQSVRQILHQYV